MLGTEKYHPVFTMNIKPESKAEKRAAQVEQIVLYAGITRTEARKVLEAIELGKIRSVRIG